MSLTPPIKELTPLIGRLFRLKSDISIGDFTTGEIFFLTGVGSLPEDFPSLRKEKKYVLNGRVWVQFPQSVVCYMLCGEKQHFHAVPYASYFFDYFELIEGV